MSTQAGFCPFRIGHGYDVHRLVAGRRLILGGVDIPFETGLDGHSDADVVTHAVMDALLGSLKLGDIGKLFPDHDDKYLNIDSMLLLSEVSSLVRQTGYSVGNIDVTVIAQRPRLSPYLNQMSDNLARTLGIDPGCVSVKATTEEHLGFTGEGLGIAVHAVCLVYNTLPNQQ